MKTLSKLEKICQRCNKVYIDKNYNKTRKYCSNSCSASTPKEKRNCEFCNKEFFVNPSKKYRFCSGSCGAKARTDRSPSAPKDIFFKNVIIPENRNLCWLYPKLIMKGYGHLYINGKKYPAHRFSYEYHNEPITNDLLYTCHICDVRLCCNPSHLFLGTHIENMKDMLIKNRHNHKLTLEQVRSIKTRIKNLESDQSIAKDFNIVSGTVGKIRRNEAWSHVLI